MVRTASDYKPFVRDHSYKAWINKLMMARGYKPNTVSWHEAQNVVKARVYRDAWVTYCPGCPGAVILEVYEPVFYCPDCQNAANDGKPYKVAFESKDEVDWLMAQRKNPRTRNWTPAETLEDLIHEQRAAGELEEGYNGI